MARAEMQQRRYGSTTIPNYLNYNAPFIGSAINTSASLDHSSLRACRQCSPPFILLLEKNLASYSATQYDPEGSAFLGRRPTTHLYYSNNPVKEPVSVTLTSSSTFSAHSVPLSTNFAVGQNVLESLSLIPWPKFLYADEVSAADWAPKSDTRKQRSR